uniref:Uncharacterized protein n=1 Tax=Lygus hesperus TaxID=30085 RepID=A0A146LCQ0_LYGHE
MKVARTTKTKTQHFTTYFSVTSIPTKSKEILYSRAVAVQSKKVEHRHGFSSSGSNDINRRTTVCSSLGPKKERKHNYCESQNGRVMEGGRREVNLSSDSKLLRLKRTKHIR